MELLFADIVWLLSSCDMVHSCCLWPGIPLLLLFNMSAFVISANGVDWCKRRFIVTSGNYCLLHDDFTGSKCFDWTVR